ncbi:MAG: manganese efflux pump MntP family protein [Clostridia bacterium]
MGLTELLLLAIGLSMDAFAAAVCQGVGMRKFSLKTSALVALFFGGFQALMPLIGWVLGVQFSAYIQHIDHWIAFGLLSLIGGKMLFEARKPNAGCACEKCDARATCPHKGQCTCEKCEPCSACDTPRETVLKLSTLLVLAIATSIDALAAGVTFAFLSVNIWYAISLIGATTFILSFAGVAIGQAFGDRFKQRAEIAGGVILVLLGLKLLLSHLGFVNF